MSNRLEVGSIAPEFVLPNAVGDEVSLADYAGQRVIVYFYPAALTPGCTTQAVDFTEASETLKESGLKVIGVSPDSPDRLAKFTAKLASLSTATSPGIELLSDSEKRVLRAYGAYGMKKLYGKEIEGVIRSTFVVAVNESGIGRIEVAQYNVRATGHVAKLRRDLGI